VPVHLDQPGLAAGLGGADDLHGLLALAAMVGQELGGSYFPLKKSLGPDLRPRSCV
jgi:hypothetical protein